MVPHSKGCSNAAFFCGPLTMDCPSPSHPNWLEILRRARARSRRLDSRARPSRGALAGIQRSVARHLWQPGRRMQPCRGGITQNVGANRPAAHAFPELGRHPGLCCGHDRRWRTQRCGGFCCRHLEARSAVDSHPHNPPCRSRRRMGRKNRHQLGWVQKPTWDLCPTLGRARGCPMDAYVAFTGIPRRPG